MDRKKILFKISILSISLLCMAAPAVSGTVPYLAKALPEVAQPSIEMLMSVPNFGILLFVFLAPFVNRFIGDKATVIAGLIISLLSGVIPFFTLNFPVLLISRFMLGCGIGLFNSLAYSLISTHYDGAERDNLIGYQGAVSALGSTLFSLIAGFLMSVNWRLSFLTYLIAIIPIMLFGLVIPNRTNESEGEIKKEKASSKSIRINGKVVFYAIYMFFVYAAFMTIIYKLASQFVEIGYATGAQASIILAIMTICGFVSGITFGSVRSIFKEFTGPLVVALLGGMIILLSFSANIILSGIIAALAGVFQGFLNPSVFSDTARVSNSASQNTASTCLLIGINLGCFLNPYIFSTIGAIFNNNTVSFSFITAGLILIICSAVHFTLELSLKNKRTNVREEI